MADYKKIVSVIKNKNKGLSWSIFSALEPPCDLGVTDTKGLFGIKKNNTSYGITWDEFVNNADSLGYVASCENFKNMPDTIYNVIFKKVFWDSIQGDKIKNQGVANALVENRGLGIAVIFDKLKNLGYVRKLEDYGTSSQNLLGNSFNLVDAEVNFINKLDDEGKSHLLFDEIKQDKDKDAVYVASKISVLTTAEKIGLGVGALFLVYLAYKLIKR